MVGSSSSIRHAALLAGLVGGLTTGGLERARAPDTRRPGPMRTDGAVPPDGGSRACPDAVGPTIVVRDRRDSPYSDLRLADHTSIDAATAQFVTPAAMAVRIGGGVGICLRGGQIIGDRPPSTDWRTMHDTYALQVRGVRDFLVTDTRTFDYGDGITFKYDTTRDWIVRSVYFKYMRDDCVENDWMNSGTIEDSFFDGCYEGLSSRPSGPTQDGRGNVVVVRKSLFRLQDMDEGYNGPGHGGFFKWGPNGPMVALYDNVYRVDTPSRIRNHTLGPPPGKLQDCARNVMVWLGPGPFPETLPDCYTLLTGAEGLQYWNDAVARWQAAHRSALPDVGSPIVAVYAPATGTTLSGTVTLTATAVDDQDVAGVQFTLDGRNIGSEVKGESPLTKFTLSWDSRGQSNGAHTLAASARDAAGNSRTSAGVMVMIRN